MDIFTDEFLAFLELKQDMLYHKIPREKIPYFIDEALSFGKSCAQELSTKKIKELFAESGISIKKESHNGVFFKVELRAQFESDRKGNNLIYLYQASIDKLAKANNMSNEQVTEIVLAHEYFHYIEDQRSQDISEILDSIVTMRILGIARTAKIRRASEIAANAFAKELLGLEYLPSYLDYQYLFKEKNMTFSDLEDDHREYREIFKK